MKSTVTSILIVLAAVLSYTLYTYGKNATAPGGTLEAQIHLLQGDQNGSNGGKFQPGIPVQIKVTVKNSGSAATQSNKIRVRYALPKPYNMNANSILFESEEIDLPSLQVGEEKEIAFNKKHQLPVVADFVRYDWPMRQYQAFIGEADKEQLIGNLSITYSAYYYEGPGKSFPAKDQR